MLNEPYKFQNNTLTNGVVKFNIGDKVSVHEKGFIDGKTYYGKISFITNMYVDITDGVGRVNRVLLSKLKGISVCR